MPTFRAKKDLELYHPTWIIVLKGSEIKAQSLMAIILSENHLIITDETKQREYLEEITRD